MIPLYLFDYEHTSNTDINVTKFVNDNLSKMVGMLLDYLTNDPDYGLDGFLPRDFLLRDPQGCRNLVDELYEILTSSVIRDYVEPKYQYLLYAILCWWHDFSDILDLIPNPLDENLLFAIINEKSYYSEDGQNYILSEILNFESYYYICFDDHDFLPSTLENMTIVFLRNDVEFPIFFPDVDLQDYVDLMPVDLRNQYLKKIKCMPNILAKSDCDIERGIIAEISRALRNFHKRVVQFQKRSETEISDDLRDNIAEALRHKYNLYVSREQPMGRAITSLGETDLYIYGDEDYAIVECKYIENFSQDFKQLLGYLNHYFHFGVTLSINKSYTLPDAMKKIETFLVDFINDDFKTISVEKIDPYILKSVHSIPENKNNHMSIYHLILHLNDIERERIAKDARPKKK